MQLDLDTGVADLALDRCDRQAIAFGYDQPQRFAFRSGATDLEPGVSLPAGLLPAVVDPAVTLTTLDAEGPVPQLDAVVENEATGDQDRKWREPQLAKV